MSGILRIQCPLSTGLHTCLVQYRLPTTGELVPLLQIAPSKTDSERLLLVSPELADVLSAVICRVRDNTGAVPLVRARDPQEHVWLPPAPLLFQRKLGAEDHVISIGLVSTLLDEGLARTGLIDRSDGGPLRCTPHDFRRMFITDAVMNGLPPHIAQIIAGHRDLNVTMATKPSQPPPKLIHKEPALPDLHRFWDATSRAGHHGTSLATRLSGLFSCHVVKKHSCG